MPMTTQYMPRTLAKALTYMAFHSPDEFGLFWDSNGTMPWKELYWALQEDPTLRFVREAHLREITYLGIDLPFILDGNKLHLKGDLSRIDYPIETVVPERLYYGCRRKQYEFIKRHGLSPSGRTYVPLAVRPDLALRIGMRRDEMPIMIEILASKAAISGIQFRKAGPELFLAATVPVDYILFPLLRQDAVLRKEVKPKKEKDSEAAKAPTHGSFFPDMHALFGFEGDHAMTKSSKPKGRRGPEWKREARKERGKRGF